LSEIDLPALGMGCSPVRGRRLVDLGPAVAAALDLGFRLFDTAEVYGTEPLLGALVEASGRRGDVVLVSKVWQTHHAFRHVVAACEGSLRRLRVDCLDLYLVHSPAAWRHRPGLEVAPEWDLERREEAAIPRDAAGAVELADVPLAETWAAMLELRRRGWVRAVGLANAGVEEVEQLAGAGLEPPAVVQAEIHPLQPRRELVGWCRRRGIRVMAHSPLGGGAALRHPRLVELAEGMGVSPARLVLSWHLERGVVPIPGAHRVAHLADDLAALGFDPGAEALAAVDSLAAP